MIYEEKILTPIINQEDACPLCRNNPCICGDEELDEEELPEEEVPEEESTEEE